MSSSGVASSSAGPEIAPSFRQVVSGGEVQVLFLIFLVKLFNTLLDHNYHYKFAKIMNTIKNLPEMAIKINCKFLFNFLNFEIIFIDQFDF